MKTQDFDFFLPKQLIAQSPMQQREQSRMLLLDRQTGAVEHKHFYDLPGLLNKGDCLVLNDTRVLPARLLGNLDTGGACEIFLLNDMGSDVWECLVNPGKKLREGRAVSFGDGVLKAQVLQVLESGNRLVKFEYDGVFLQVLDKLGEMPLPPYIKNKLMDKERYQTVYSRVPGSSAAPTAGLHFTNEILEQIRQKGVELAYITLHIGLGTFRPVKVREITQHKMHSEFFSIDPENAARINRVKEQGGRIISVGTTVCRTMESAAVLGGDGYRLQPGSGDTDIFIYPGYEFKMIDGLVTNFHLPQSTLIMLVSAFAGREQVLAAYNTAVENEYRFFSFGDSMAIL